MGTLILFVNYRKVAGDNFLDTAFYLGKLLGIGRWIGENDFYRLSGIRLIGLCAYSAAGQSTV